MDVRVEGDGNRTAGGDYREERSVQVRIGKVSISVPASQQAQLKSAQELQAQHAHLGEVHRALRRRFVQHRTVRVFVAWSALLLVAMLAAWGDSPGSPASVLLLLLAVGAVASAFLMVQERKALYAELRQNKDERHTIERDLVRTEAEAEAIRKRQARGG